MFVGGSDPSQAEQWMSRIISILDFMRVAVNDKMGMCCLGTAGRRLYHVGGSDTGCLS